jgi:hypothetical protein
MTTLAVDCASVLNPASTWRTTEWAAMGSAERADIVGQLQGLGFTFPDGFDPASPVFPTMAPAPGTICYPFWTGRGSQPGAATGALEAMPGTIGEPQTTFNGGGGLARFQDLWNRLRDWFERMLGQAGRWVLYAILAALAAFLAVRYAGARAETAGRRA